MLSDDDHTRLDSMLGAAPDVGPIIRGTGGVRKLRVRVAGRGKRGAIRVIYYYRRSRERVYLILAYAKSAGTALTDAEKARMRTLTRRLEGES